MSKKKRYSRIFYLYILEFVITGFYDGSFPKKELVGK